MKKLVLFFTLAVCAMSCMNNGSYETSGTVASTFEYTSEEEKQFVDSVYFTNDFVSGAYLAYNGTRTANEPFELLGGFGLSMKRDSSLSLTASPYSVFAKGGAYKSRSFAVFYDTEAKPKSQFTFLAASSGTRIGKCTPAFCMVNNTQLVVSNILSEDSPLKFKSGDYLKLTVTGFLNGKETGKAEWYLADYRTPEAKDSVTTTWKIMSLKKLGEVDTMDFSLESSKPELPKYFCLDNLVANIYLKQ